MTDDDGVYRIPSWDAKEPPYDQGLLAKHIFLVLAASDKPLQEFDIVQGVLKTLKPKEIWYQMITKTLEQLQKENRVFCFQEPDYLAALSGIHTVRKSYTISNPLDGLAAI